MRTYDQAAESKALESALETFQRQRATLLRPDGERLYSDDEHQRREAALLAELDTSIAAVTARAESTIAEAEREALLADRDPIATLPTDELTRAAALAPFVAEDAGRLDFATLARRCEAALALRDGSTGQAKARAHQAVYARYGRARLDRARGDRTIPIEQLPGVRALETAVQQLEAAFGDPAAAHAAVLTRRDDARGVVYHAKRVRGVADGTEAAARERVTRELARTF